MVSNWDNIKQTVKDELSDAATATRKYFYIGKNKLDIMQINQSLDNTYQELGIEVHRQMNNGSKKDIRKNPTVLKLIKKINVFKQDIRDDQQDIKDIRKESGLQTKGVKNAKSTPVDKTRKTA